MSQFLSLVPQALTASRSTLSHLPTWWDGESLYGWSSRVHALRGGKARVTGRLLFGREHACRMVDIPAGLGRLVAASAGDLGGVEEILRQRTVIAAYWPFATAATRAIVKDAAADVNGVSIPMAMGLPASRLGAHHPLRYCRGCHLAALAKEGYSTWLLNQQLPGVWWCALHQTPLAQVSKRRSIWSTPGCDATALGTPGDAHETKALATMAQLAKAISSMDHVNEVTLTAMAIHRLRQIGIAASVARLNTARMSDWLEASPLIKWMRRQGHQVHTLNGNWAVDLLRGRARAHPLKWQILWTCAWQTESSESSVRAFVNAAQNQREFVDATQADLWTPMISAPPQLSAPPNVVDAFARHDTLRDVADGLKTSIGAVRQWLADYPTLANDWMLRVRADRKTLAVKRIEAAMQQVPQLTRTGLLNICNTDFNWLDRHSPATMRALLNRVPRDRGPQRELF